MGSVSQDSTWQLNQAITMLSLRSEFAEPLKDAVVSVLCLDRKRHRFQARGIMAHKQPVPFAELERLAEHILRNPECFAHSLSVTLAGQLGNKVRVRLSHD